MAHWTQVSDRCPLGCLFFFVFFCLFFFFFSTDRSKAVILVLFRSLILCGFVGFTTWSFVLQLSLVSNCDRLAWGRERELVYMLLLHLMVYFVCVTFCISYFLFVS